MRSEFQANAVSTTREKCLVRKLVHTLAVNMPGLHTCPIHSIRVGLSSLSGGLSPIATGSGNGCMAVDQW